MGQSITVDLGEVYRITRVATQGRRHSREWVRQYSLQYGFNGRDFMDYRGPHGGAWVSRGARGTGTDRTVPLTGRDGEEIRTGGGEECRV